MNNNKYILFFLIIVFVILSASCEKNKSVMELKIKNKIDALDDTTFIGGVGGLANVGGKLFISDYKNNCIYCIDNKFKVLKIIGRTGNGPGEFNSAGELTIKDSLLFASTHNRINVFTLDGQLVKTLINYRDISAYKFAIDRGMNIFFSKPSNSGHLITKIDSSGKIISSFGKLLIDQARFIYARNIGNVLQTEDEKLIYISATEPIIRKYSMSGKMLKELNLSMDTYVKRRMKVSEKFYKSNPDGHGSAILFYSANIYKNQLYVLAFSFIKSKPVDIVYVLNLNTFNLKKTFILNQGSFYRKIVIWNNNIICFDTVSAAFHVYDISFFIKKNIGD